MIEEVTGLTEDDFCQCSWTSDVAHYITDKDGLMAHVDCGKWIIPDGRSIKIGNPEAHARFMNALIRTED